MGIEEPVKPRDLRGRAYSDQANQEPGARRGGQEELRLLRDRLLLPCCIRRSGCPLSSFSTHRFIRGAS